MREVGIAGGGASGADARPAEDEEEESCNFRAGAPEGRVFRDSCGGGSDGFRERDEDTVSMPTPLISGLEGGASWEKTREMV